MHKVLPQLESPVDHVRKNAVICPVTVGDKSAVPALEKLLGDRKLGKYADAIQQINHR